MECNQSNYGISLPDNTVFMVETDDEIHSMYVSKELHKEYFGLPCM